MPPLPSPPPLLRLYLPVIAHFASSKRGAFSPLSAWLRIDVKAVIATLRSCRGVYGSAVAGEKLPFGPPGSRPSLGHLLSRSAATKMNILVHNALMVEELPAGVCSIFTISHVAVKDARDR